MAAFVCLAKEESLYENAEAPYNPRRYQQA